MKICSISQRRRASRLTSYPLAFLLCSAVATSACAQTLTTLHSFNGTDGSYPFTELVQASVVQLNNGNFYGTTPVGGANSAGAVFQITPSGVETTIYSFCKLGGCADGEFPEGGLVVGKDGNLYGTTYAGGAKGDGTLFQITPSGVLTTIHSFSGSDGANPVGSLSLNSNQSTFYGTTYAGGAKGAGTVFQVAFSGFALTTLYSFSGPDGANPEGSLLIDKGGNLWGATLAGGNSMDAGTIFRVSVGGQVQLSTVYQFCSSVNCTDGAYPNVPLVEDVNNNIYGTTESYGANAGGTLFILPNGGSNMTPIYHFCSQANCADGGNPTAGPTLDSDGELYGVAAIGGAENSGTVFQVTTSGMLTTVYNFCSVGGANCTDGAYPEGSLLLGSNGNFYGTTSFGGADNQGTVFTLTPPVPSNGNGCNGVYYGQFNGSLNVAAGQVCEFTDGGSVSGNVQVNGGTFILQNGTVQGSIQTQNANSLTVQNSSVQGNVQIQGSGTFTLGPGLTVNGNVNITNLTAGSSTNTICGVKTNGDMLLQNSAGGASIGSTSSSCPGNTVGGNLIVQNNTAPVQIDSNTVTNALEVDNNKALMQVFDNTVKSILQCQNNTSITGGGNTASQKELQCASF